MNKYLEAAKRYRDSHKDKIRRYLKEWRLANTNQCKAYQKKYRKKHHKEVRERFKQWSVIRYTQCDKLILEQKKKPCIDCKIQYHPWQMDFDHVRGKKVCNVSEMRRSPLKVLGKEIAKCEVVCANCHRQRTYQRRQHEQYD